MSRSRKESLEGGWAESKRADDPQGAKQDPAARRDEVRQTDGRSIAGGRRHKVPRGSARASLEVAQAHGWR